jgi:hypothetical protein
MRIVRYLLRFSLLPDRWQIVIRLGYASGPAGVLFAAGVLVPAVAILAPTAANAVSRRAVISAIATAHPRRSLENRSILLAPLGLVLPGVYPLIHF